ncbi:MAG: tetratricopeptide repeat protein [Bryobacteraceae bacterium]
MRIALSFVVVAGLAFAQDTAPATSEVEKHFDLAIQHSIDGKDAEAIPEYLKVLELMPDLYEAHINLGQVLLRSNKPAEALPHLKRAHEQKPAEFRPAYYLAEALFDLGQFAEAIPPYTAAVGLDAKSAPAELGWGRALARLDKRVEAAPHYRKAVELDPQLKSFLLELAQAHEDKGEVEQAVAIFKEFPENPGAVEHLGLLALKSGQDKEAIAALESAVKTSPTPGNRLALAQAYVRAKDLPKAEALLAIIVTTDKTFDQRMFYARVLRDQRKIKEAAQQFYEATKLRPTAADAWSEFAGMLILDEQYPQALLALDKVKELGAENVGHMFFRATTLDRLNLRKEALDYYQRFLEQSKTNPDQEFQARQRARILELDLGKR